MSVVDDIIALMHKTESDDDGVATLAKMVLSLVECVRDYEARIGFAEAALEAEKAKVAALEEAISQAKGISVRAKPRKREDRPEAVTGASLV